MALIDINNANGRIPMLNALKDLFNTAVAVATDDSEFIYNILTGDFEVTTNDPATLRLAAGKKLTFNINQAGKTIDEILIRNTAGNLVVKIDPEAVGGGYSFTNTGTLEITGITINLNDEIT